MAFLFKSKKSQDRALSSRDGNSGSQGSIQSASSRMARDEKGALAQRSTPTGSLTSLDNDGSVGSPDRGHGRRGGSVDNTQPSDLPLRNGPQPTNPNASLYPWSQRRLTYTTSHPSPFPRYGAAVNATSSKEGDIYMMGGLINSSTVKGDLWMIEAGGNMACYPLATTAEGPGPRVGHASLLVGNAFIVYGGDTKIEESDALDETLYLLNTSTRHWSRALPAGPRPSGRYGHSLNILGSKIYIFGGQVEGHFMNDLSAFDLNQLQMPNNRWEILLQGESSPKAPAARTNHSMVTFNDKMYLFGGTNGYQWFNDVWCYDPAVNTWAQLDCIGYIPAPREGHAASLVDDVMYVFGGRTEEGSDLGDLAAFRISTRRWYTFQNMGPSPSSRSGHSMTTVGKSIVVLGGEPSSAASAINDLGILYVLDTSKIRYPNDSQQGAQKITQGRRPSASDVQNPPRAMPAREGSIGPSDSRKGSGGAIAPMVTPTNGHKSPTPGVDARASPNSAAAGPAAAVKSRAALTSSPAGPPPQGPTPAKPTGDPPSSVGRVRGLSADRAGATPPAQPPASRDAGAENAAAGVNGRRTPTHAARGPAKQELAAIEPTKTKQTRHGQSSGSVDSSTEAAARAVRPSSPPPPTRQPSNPLSRRSSGRNSQTVALLKELDASRNRNAWYASELELARKSGYVSTATFSPTLDAKAAETFDDEDRPLIEALLAMRTELANVQSAVDKQAVLSAKQIAEAEKQRDAAIQEAVYAKARLAAHQGGSASSTPQLDRDRDDGTYRESELSKKLASALHVQRSLQSQVETARSELEAEKKARKLADDTAGAAQRRMGDLETYKQQTSTEVERLKAELHLMQREARDQSVACAEAVAALELLKIEKEDFATKYDEAVGNAKDHDESFQSLRDAIAASEDARTHLEQKLEEERAQKQDIEAKLSQLKAEHEARTTELVSTTQRLQDAEELAKRHAHEAKTHRQAVLAGLDKISTRDVSAVGKADTERLTALQNQVAAANALVKKYQQEADTAAAKLRSAEERIAGLEQYQEQASREGVTIRRQLQSSLREVQSLQAAHSDVKNRLAAQQLETNAMTVQHNALKDILNERGISPTSAVRGRGLTSPRDTSPEQTRMRDLEMQLASATAAHEEVKQAFAAQAQESELAYREKLSQLESDYQSAVHYVKGTEKMLKQLKDQLSRYKTDNGRLKAEIEELESRAQEGGGDRSVPPGDWENERDALHKRIEGLEAELRNSSAQLDKGLQSLRTELAESNRQRDEAAKAVTSHRKDLEQLQSENALLEQRATDAEQKVSLLLDQVEHSVDSYRRRSRQLPAEAVAEAASNANGLGGGHARSESSGTESAYGGNGLDNRDSAALDNLASELETLRSHWEATNKNYRLSTNFDFDQPTPVSKKEDDALPGAALGLSESLADWRKRLDTDDHQTGADKPHQN
ncbi:Negative regulator of mitotic exit [Purpureocillium takamizusanense]|uniref:Negative regulator of mitotic exit n=1 Tax=Purpureocillium takamizusanense TaxID=2060973 RepID=A0A9Q8VGT0_9HYPO|nr:Negative regulator of mitotic exit [Purpureocillium takamizusanense]UNI24199.1 Negative regulator of mitotic exit [Purpureocillium takamizusanense]